MSEYCLRWNNHRPNLVTVFSELLTSEALVDVTLATDGHYIRAHKLVLSACSIYFKDLFASSPCKHPIVILKDISIEALKTVIDFIYRGEVTVSQDKLQEVLRTAESLRIKGLTDNPRSYDELPSHGLRNTSSSFSSQATRQRSSLTDSRDQSLSLEGEDEGEPGTPPSSKKRKIASEHDSLESSQDNAETEENNGLGDVKPEPSEDRDNERSLSRGTESEYNMGSSLENAEEAGGAAGSSDSATPQHPQGRGGKRGLLQRQQGIIKDAAVEERKEENQIGGTQQLQVPESTRLSGENNTTFNVVTSANANAITTTTNSTGTRIPAPGAIIKAESQQEVLIPDTVVVSGSMPQPTLLQVPAVMVGSPRDSLAPTPPPLSKTHSIPTSTPLLAPATLSKQASQPEFRGPPTHQGPPALSKQRSHPGVLNYTPSIERVPSNISNSSIANQQQQQQQQQYHLQQQQQASASQQHLQVIPMQAVFVKQRSSPGSLPSISAQQLRPIQPKPSDGAADIIKIKDLPTIRVMPSEDIGPGGGGGGAPPPMQRAVSEDPSPYRLSTTSTADHLLPGPSVLVQSVSQDSGLDNRADQYRIASPQLNPSMHTPPIRPPSITPLHCPALRNGPALGCNFCWNSTDTQGRVLRRKTKYHCPECRTNLCIVPCFHEYHKQMERAQDTQKQISKILTKTGSI